MSKNPLILTGVALVAGLIIGGVVLTKGEAQNALPATVQIPKIEYQTRADAKPDGAELKLEIHTGANPIIAPAPTPQQPPAPEPQPAPTPDPAPTPEPAKPPTNHSSTNMCMDSSGPTVCPESATSP